MTSTCKYCLEEDKIKNLICPCKCNGSMKYVHPMCFYKWQDSCDHDEHYPMTCEICHYRYVFEKDPVSKLYERLSIMNPKHLYLLFLCLWKIIPFITFYNYNKYMCELFIAIQLHYATIVKKHTSSYGKALYCLFVYYILIQVCQFMYTWLSTALLSLYGFVLLKLHIYIMDQVPVRKKIINYPH